MLSPAHCLLLSAFIVGTCGVPHSRRGGFGGGLFGGPAAVPDYGDYYNYGFPMSGRGSFGGARGGQPCPSGQTSSTPLTDQQVQDLTDAFFAATENEQRLMLKDFLTSLGGGGGGGASSSSRSVQFPDYGDYEEENNGRGRGRGNGNRGGHFRG